MSSRRVPGLFIAGTDTGVGKTYVAALIARALRHSGRRVGVYKPAASGCVEQAGAVVSDDARSLWEAAGRPGELDRVCPQRFLAPLAPHLAAAAQGERIDRALLTEGIRYWEARSEVILVEGVGGLLTPLSGDCYVADLAREFGYPLVVVAPNALGTINQTLQTLFAAAAFCAGLPIAGVVLNRRSADPDPSVATNRREIAARAEPPVLAEVLWQAQQFDAPVDWLALAR